MSRPRGPESFFDTIHLILTVSTTDMKRSSKWKGLGTWIPSRGFMEIVPDWTDCPGKSRHDDAQKTSRRQAGATAKPLQATCRPRLVGAGSQRWLQHPGNAPNSSQR